MIPLKVVKIEKGVPLPETRGNSKSNQGYGNALRTMSVGESFVAPKTIRQAFSTIAKNAGVTITLRTISDTEIRVWLVSKTRLPEA